MWNSHSVSVAGNFGLSVQIKFSSTVKQWAASREYGDSHGGYAVELDGKSVYTSFWELWGEKYLIKIMNNKNWMRYMEQIIIILIIVKYWPILVLICKI